jgi:flagellar biogenesis protein FliO
MSVLCISIFTGGSLFSQDDKKSSQPQDEQTLVIPDDSATTAKTNAKGTELVPIWDFLRMLLILGAVIGVIYVFFYFLKKGVKKRLPESDLVKVLGFTALRGNTGLYLVELGTNIYLVGASENGMSLISTVTDKETIDIVRLHAAESGLNPKMNFSDFFAKLLKPKEKEDAAGSANPIDFLKRQKERIKSLK